jgi:hypothetical protein
MYDRRVKVRFTQMGLILGMALALGANVPAAWADPEGGPVSLVGMKSGIVTDVTDHAVIINGQAYGTTTDVVVVNQYGKSDGLDSLRKDLEVYFHLRKGEVEKSELIDKMVLVIPQ